MKAAKFLILAPFLLCLSTRSPAQDEPVLPPTNTATPESPTDAGDAPPIEEAYFYGDSKCQRAKAVYTGSKCGSALNPAFSEADDETNKVLHDNCTRAKNKAFDALKARMVAIGGACAEDIKSVTRNDCKFCK